MNIAIIFSGRIYKFANHYNNIMDNLVQDNNVDFFLSHSPELDEDLDLFYEIYNPVSICNEPLELFDYTKYPVPDLEHRPHNILSMYYNRRRGFQALNNHIQKTGKIYDAVISHRLDLFCFDTLDLSLVNNGLCIPTCHARGIFDQFALGTLLSIQPYMNVYNHIQTLLENHVTFNSEVLLEYALKGLHIFRFPFHTRLIRHTHGYSF
jgi:hypothetical protein